MRRSRTSSRERPGGPKVRTDSRLQVGGNRGYDPDRDDADAFEGQIKEFDMRLKLLKDQGWGRQQRVIDLEAKIDRAEAALTE